MVPVDRATLHMNTHVNLPVIQDTKHTIFSQRVSGHNDGRSVDGVQVLQSATDAEGRYTR